MKPNTRISQGLVVFLLTASLVASGIAAPISSTPSANETTPVTSSPSPSSTPTPTPTPTATPTPTQRTIGSTQDVQVDTGGPMPWIPPPPTPTPTPDCGGTSFAYPQPLPSGTCTMRGTTVRYFTAGSGYVVAVEWTDKQIPGCSPDLDPVISCNWGPGGAKCIQRRTVCTKENAETGYTLQQSGGRITLSPDGTASNFDLRLLDSDGLVVQSSQNSAGYPDSVTLSGAAVPTHGQTPAPGSPSKPAASCAAYSTCTSCTADSYCAWSPSQGGCVPWRSAGSDAAYSPEGCALISAATSAPTPRGTSSLRVVCEDGSIVEGSRSDCPRYQCPDGSEAGSPEKCLEVRSTSRPGATGSRGPRCTNVTVENRTIQVCEDESGITIPKGLPTPGFEAVFTAAALGLALFLRRRR